MEKTNPMKYFISTFIPKPIVGIIAGFGSGVSALLSLCHIIGALFGAIGAAVGATIAMWHLYYLIKKWWKTKNTEDAFSCDQMTDCPFRQFVKKSKPDAE